MTVQLSAEQRQDRAGNRYIGAPVPARTMQVWRQALRAKVGAERAVLLEEHKLTRDGAGTDGAPEFHITVVTPSELESLPAAPRDLPVSWEVTLLGIGTVQDGEAESWYVVAESPDAQEFRDSLGLGPHPLHVTLGFASQDIHHLPKDRSTLVAAETFLPSVAEMPDAPATIRISSGLTSLQPSEQRVARFALEDPERIVESTAQELAGLIGVSRSTVVRTCRSLGYTGYPQFRVALAREVPAGQGAAEGEGGLRSEARRIADGLRHVFDAVGEGEAEQLVERLVGARRLLVIANGQSAPCALDLSLRLTAAGRPAEFIADAIAQQVAVRLLGERDLCVVISSSGVNDITHRTVKAARNSSAFLVALTSHEESPVAQLADETVMIIPPPSSFLESLEDLSRLHYTLAVEALARQVQQRLGASGRLAQSGSVDVLAQNIVD